MNKKTVIALAVAALSCFAMARPGPGGFCGLRGGFHGGPRFHHGGFHGGFHGGLHGGPRFYHGGYHHHHHHHGWGWGLGAAGIALGTAAVVRDIVAPRTVYYSSYGTPVTYSTYPYATTYVAPAVYPTVTYPPVVTYGVASPCWRRW